MNVSEKTEDHMTSYSAFVEGGVQESGNDACSICLEDFCASIPFTVTSCKHGFHLQCILEWCQRSSQCPMCWQPISLKDPTSLEFLEAAERERNLRAVLLRNATIFHRPSLGEFESRHRPVGASDANLGELIIQHLAAAAARRRTRHFGQSEVQINGSSPHGRQNCLAFSTHLIVPYSGHVFPTLTRIEGENGTSSGTAAFPSTTHAYGVHTLMQQALQPHSAPTDQSFSASGSTIMVANCQRTSFNYRSTSNQSPQQNQNRAGPSNFQSFSGSLKSRFNVVSTKYKETISRSTRGWKERLFPRSRSMSALG